jgi:hypothetical protein
MGYDVSCAQLAHSFLEDHGLAQPEIVRELAQRLQDEIEEFIDEYNQRAGEPPAGQPAP